MKWDPVPAGDSLGTNSFYKHKHAYAQLNGKCTQLDLIEQRSCIRHKLQMDTGMFEILDGLLATSVCYYVAHGFCTWALHRDHPGKHQRVQPHYIAAFNFPRMSSWVLHVWMLANQTSEF
jgi:hypothetical protein